MFSTITPCAPQNDRAHPAATAVKIRPPQFPRAAQPIDEAYEMRLLAEVARWDDQAAFEEIFARHRAAVTRVAFAVCADAYVAEDVAMHVFTALWIRAQRLVDRSVRLRPWLTTVARNAAIDCLRGEHRSTFAIAQAADTCTFESSPEDAALASESRTELARAIATLPAEQRRAIELVFTMGLTYAAAANATGEPIGTVKSRVRLAVGHLRKRYRPTD